MKGRSAPEGLDRFVEAMGSTADPAKAGREALARARAASPAARDGAWWLLAADALITEGCSEVLREGGEGGDAEEELKRLMTEVASAGV